MSFDICRNNKRYILNINLSHISLIWKKNIYFYLNLLSLHAVFIFRSFFSMQYFVLLNYTLFKMQL